MFLNVLRAQQVKTIRSGLFWVELALLVGVTALLAVLTNTMTDLKNEASTTVAGQVTEMLEHLASSTMGHVAALVLAGALLAHEYGWRSLHLWLSRGVSRSTFLWAKFAALLLPIALFFAATVAVVAPIAAAFILAEHGTVGPLAGELAGIGGTAALGAFAVLPYASLAVLLAVAGRSMLVAVGGGLALTLIGETLVVQLLGILGDSVLEAAAYLPSGLALGVLGMEMEGSFTPLEPASAALLIAGYTLALMLAATLLFRKQDLSD